YEVVGHLGLRITAAGCVAPARATKIRDEHPVSIRGQGADQAMPLPPVLWEAMNQHDRGAVAGTRLGEVNPQAAGRRDVAMLDARQLRRWVRMLRRHFADHPMPGDVAQSSVEGDPPD